MSWSDRNESVLRNSIHKDRLWVPRRREQRWFLLHGAHRWHSSSSPSQGKSGNDGHESDLVLPLSYTAFSKTQSCCAPSGSSIALLSAGTGHRSHWKQRHHSHCILFSALRRTRCARNCMNKDKGTVHSLMKSSSQTQQGQEMITWLWFPLAVFS